MATWHQQRSRVQLWHATQWTVVIDPPNACRAIARFDTMDQAETYLRNVRERGERHAYTIAPQKVSQ